MTTETAVQDKDRRADARLIGTFHRFGEAGPVYEVISLADEGFVTICLVESGETARYPADEVRNDPPP
jgi:Family of unknown function (DUF5397)